MRQKEFLYNRGLYLNLICFRKSKKLEYNVKLLLEKLIYTVQLLLEKLDHMIKVGRLEETESQIEVRI